MTDFFEIAFPVKVIKHGLMVHFVSSDLACTLGNDVLHFRGTTSLFYPIAGYVKYMQNVNAVLLW